MYDLFRKMHQFQYFMYIFINILVNGDVNIYMEIEHFDTFLEPKRIKLVI